MALVKNPAAPDTGPGPKAGPGPVPMALGGGVTVILPSLNEAALPEVVEGLRRVLAPLAPAFEILVVDDGSEPPVQGPSPPEVRVIRHPETLGYGASIRTGLREARHPWIAITDADGSYPPENLEVLIRGSPGYDMVVGSRMNPGQPRLFRKPARWFLTKLANYLSGRKIPDINSGQRIFRKEVAERFISLLPSGFSFTTTITLAFLSESFPVAFIPVPYASRKGRSKFRPIHDTARMLTLILRTVLYFNPLKIFLPLSFLTLAFALALFLVTSFLPESVNPFHAWEMPTLFLVFLSGQFFAIGLLAEVVRRRR